MDLAGNLTEFSLPEVFQFLEQGQKTGLLTVHPLITSGFNTLYVWLQHGRIIAAADRLDRQGLMSLLQHRNWVSDRVVSKIPLICSLNSSLGLCLKSQGILDAEQLKLLFRIQVMSPMRSLFETRDGKFEFDPTAPLPYAEMTGLSLAATEATLIGLRLLRDWQVLTDKLPDPTSGLTSSIRGQPHLKLEAQEWQVWEFANGTVSLQAIAQNLGLPVETIQQIAFRLIVVNLAEEIFLVAATPTSTKPILSNIIINDFPIRPAAAGAEANAGSGVSKSFLHNLVGFLKGKT